MAIAIDATSGATSNTTLSHTCTGSNLGLIVVVYDDGSNSVSGVTYNSVAMTKVQQVDRGTRSIYVYYLVNPATGTHNIVVSGATSLIAMSGASYTGVNQSETTCHKSGQAQTAYPSAARDDTVSLTTTVDGCWLITFQNASGANPTAALVATTARVGSLTTDGAIHDTNGTKVAGTYAPGYSYPGTSGDSVIAVAIAVATAAGGANHWLLMGV